MPPMPLSFESIHFTKSSKSSLYFFGQYCARSCLTLGPMWQSLETMTTFSSRFTAPFSAMWVSSPIALSLLFGFHASSSERRLARHLGIHRAFQHLLHGLVVHRHPAQAAPHRVRVLPAAVLEGDVVPHDQVVD